ncbi:MAG TPA: hypothetical protein VNF47_10775 [Streptosporangiaceae bacterium]|nr:hypothetical protein [Streptosporangiaceae bacterium]
MRALVIVLGLVAVGCSTSSATLPGPSAVRAPAPISARVVLPERAMTAGSSMSGHVVVENDTGRAIRTSGCLTLFQVALASSSYHPAIAWLDCLQSFTIPVGQSSYPVTVVASYGRCSQGRPSDAIKACLPGGHPPALPPGIYRAVLFHVRHLVPVPPPVTVRVTPR